MRKILIFAMLTYAVSAQAGWLRYIYNGGIAKGANIETYQIKIGSTTDNVLISANTDMVDGGIYNDSTYDLFVGSSGVKANNGFVIKANSFFSFDGRYEGSMSAIYEAGASTTTVYVIKFIRR